MANLDRPNGFTPIKTLSGAPFTQMIRSIGVADGDNLYIGDIINLESGLADVGDTGDAALLGVCVGFGKKDGANALAYNPDDLGTIFYDDAANTNTDWVCFYVPVDDVIFEAQTATALTLAVGDTCDLADAGGGDSNTGRSTAELTTSTNADFTVVEVPNLVNNDNTAVNGRYWVMVTRAEQAFHA
jgi:hypothetical protein